ncbi:hypothetical protein HanIR_Chr10g0497251 [Helianthus annuus]|nr:hypothetical protein HanIR_Chr10g0497251 [Helianthus annuus]
MPIMTFHGTRKLDLGYKDMEDPIDPMHYFLMYALPNEEEGNEMVDYFIYHSSTDHQLFPTMGLSMATDYLTYNERAYALYMLIPEELFLSIRNKHPVHFIEMHELVYGQIELLP